MNKIIIGLVCVMCLCGCGQEVKSGQVWVYTYKKANPFEEAKSCEATVLDVKDGYVQFRWDWSDKKRVQSIYYFKIGSEMKWDVQKNILDEIETEKVKFLNNQTIPEEEL